MTEFWSDPALNLLKALPDPLVTLDAGLKIRFANPAAENLLGKAESGTPLTALLRQPEIAQAAQRCLKTRNPESVEIILFAPVERVFNVTFLSLPPEFGKQAGLMVVLRELTEIRRSEKMRGDFVANVSHELRTPLSAISGFLEVLSGPAKDDAKTRDKFFPIMIQQAKLMATLVEDLLALSRIEVREHAQPDETVEVEELLQEVAHALSLEIKKKNMRLIVKCDENLPPLRGDREEVERVLHNLISNAWRYGNPGTDITVTAQKAATLPPHIRAPRQGMIEIKVEDRGIGIEARHIPRLTERFYRVDKARSREAGGTGLGLAIVKHIMSRHRGALVIESTPGVGSVFSLYFPVAAGSKTVIK
ncbi:MAG: ATP-binding protein [Dongiaceae bacterium]